MQTRLLSPTDLMASSAISLANMDVPSLPAVCIPAFARVKPAEEDPWTSRLPPCRNTKAISHFYFIFFPSPCTAHVQQLHQQPAHSLSFPEHVTHLLVTMHTQLPVNATTSFSPARAMRLQLTVSAPSTTDNTTTVLPFMPRCCSCKSPVTPACSHLTTDKLSALLATVVRLLL